MKLRILFFSISVLVFIQCKQESNNKTEIAASTAKDPQVYGDTTAPMPINKPSMTPEYTIQLNKQAESILKYRRQNKPVNDAILDVGVWEYDMIFQDDKMSKVGEHKGKWIDFDEKGNYEYGFQAELQGKGQFHYDNESNLLLMVDNDKTKKPREYELKFAGSAMIMIGKQTYQDNNYQAKLAKIAARPK
jgi:hypothetical protein